MITVYEVVLDLPRGVKIVKCVDLQGTPESIDKQFTSIRLLAPDRVFIPDKEN